MSALETATNERASTAPFRSLREAIDSLPDRGYDVDRAYSLASLAHQAQERKGGEKYQKHLERVALACANYARATRMPDAEREQLLIAALLHDTLEDMPVAPGERAVTADEIAKEWGKDIADVVASLSHPKKEGGEVDEDEPADVYLRRVHAGGRHAIIIKRYDRIDNINSLWQAPADFRARRLAEAKEALPLWREIDAEGAREIEQALERAEYVHAALANLQATSRTASGEVNVEVAEEKADAVTGISGKEAADTATANFVRVIEKLFAERDRTFKDASELRAFVEDAAKGINEGIIKEGILIRTHNTDMYPYTRTENLEEAMSQFYTEFLEKLRRGDDPKEVAAWVEYRIDLTDHFFADGCGKTAKAIAVWVLMRAKQSLPVYRSRDEYYGNARGGYDAWITYYKSLFQSA